MTAQTLLNHSFVPVVAALLAVWTSLAAADETRVVMRDGVAYRETTRISRVPTTRYESREEQQTALVEQTRTYEQTYTRTLYQPMVQTWHRPQMIAWPNGAPQPTMSSQAVAVMRYIPKEEVVKVPIVTREIRPAVRTVTYQERILSFDEQPMLVASEVAPEYSEPGVLTEGSNGAIAGLPPVSSDYLANGAMPDGRYGNNWPEGYSALNGTHYQYGYGSGFPTSSQSGWGQGPSHGVTHPVVASNAWPTNDWSTSGWPGSRTTSPYAGRGQGSWSALFPTYDTSSPGPFGGLGRNLWSRLNAKGTLADYNNSSTSSLSPMGSWWNPNAPAGAWPTTNNGSFAPPATTSYLPPTDALPPGPGYLGNAPVTGLGNPLAPPATRSGLSTEWSGQAPVPPNNWLNGAPGDVFSDGVAPPPG